MDENQSKTAEFNDTEYWFLDLNFLRVIFPIETFKITGCSVAHWLAVAQMAYYPRQDAAGSAEGTVKPRFLRVMGFGINENEAISECRSELRRHLEERRAEFRIEKTEANLTLKW